MKFKRTVNRALELVRTLTDAGYSQSEVASILAAALGIVVGFHSKDMPKTLELADKLIRKVADECER